MKERYIKGAIKILKLYSRLNLLVIKYLKLSFKKILLYRNNFFLVIDFY